MCLTTPRRCNHSGNYVERVCISESVGSTDSMGEEDAVQGGEIVMTPREEEAVPSKPPDNRKLELVQKMLGGCLKHGLAALCKEKPEEPIKWLAHWLLDNNPNQPRVHMPRLGCPVLPVLPRAAPRCPAPPGSAVCTAARLARQSLCRVLTRAFVASARCQGQGKRCPRRRLQRTSRARAKGISRTACWCRIRWSAQRTSTSSTRCPGLLASCTILLTAPAL
jgi:hypothetical protein